MTRPTLINLNPVELNYYPSIISLDKYNGRYYGVDLSTKIFVQSVIKKNVKVFNVIRRINEVKTLLNIFHVAVIYQHYFKNRTCNYFDDIIRIDGFHFNNILFDEEPYKSILIYDIRYKTWISAKSYLHFIFDKVHCFTKDN